MSAKRNDQRPSVDHVDVYIAESSTRIAHIETTQENIARAIEKLHDQMQTAEKDIIRLGRIDDLQQRVEKIGERLEKAEREIVTGLEKVTIEIASVLKELNELRVKQLQEIHALDKDVAHEQGKLKWVYAGIVGVAGAVLGGFLQWLFKKS